MILSDALLTTHQLMMIHPLASLCGLLAYAMLVGMAWCHFAHVSLLLPRPVLIHMQMSKGEVLVKVQIKSLEIHWLG